MNVTINAAIIEVLAGSPVTAVPMGQMVLSLSEIERVAVRKEKTIIHFKSGTSFDYYPLPYLKVVSTDPLDIKFTNPTSVQIETMQDAWGDALQGKVGKDEFSLQEFLNRIYTPHPTKENTGGYIPEDMRD